MLEKNDQRSVLHEKIGTLSCTACSLRLATKIAAKASRCSCCAICFGMCFTDVVSMITKRTVCLQALLQVLGIEVRHWWVSSCGHSLGNALLPGCASIMSAKIV